MQFTEEEERLISWLRQNYLNIILGLAIGFTSTAGYNYYQSSAMNAQHQISLDYQEIVKLYQAEKFSSFSDKANILVKKNPENIYSAMTNLYLAKYHHDNNQLDEALKSLSHILANSKSQSHVYIASLRLARINILQGEYVSAIEVLSSIEDGSTDPIVLELLGDIMLIQNDKLEAIKNYESALSQDPTPNKAKLIESKLSTIR